MTWEYGVIGLVVGMAIGAITMRFGSRTLRSQHQIQYELEKTRAELADHKKDLKGHFERSTELLDKMAQDYRDLHQHLTRSSIDMLPEHSVSDPRSVWQLSEAEAGNDQTPIEIPRDYSEGASGILRGTTQR